VTTSRLLSIGEFAAATQLSPKALRLYDEQQLLRPARIDAASGYRYYRSDQVSLGRLIRTLRDMSLPLADIARIAVADGGSAERLLSRFAGELDSRYAREKRAFQRALLLLRGASRAEVLTVAERVRPGMTVVVTPFLTDRARFHERMRAQIAAARASFRQSRLEPLEESYCRLVEPLSDEEAQLELLSPVDAPSAVPEELTFRHLTPAHCAVVSTDGMSLQGAEFGAAFDTMFDWFDRHGYRTTDVPWLSHTGRGAESSAELLWAYEPGPGSTR
jgi:DNA-binding transcriptional MerR regulator